MPHHYLLEREYLRSEYDCALPLRLLVVGLLLGFAFGRQSVDKRIEALIAELDAGS